jgi:hypothetical protein
MPAPFRDTSPSAASRFPRLACKLVRGLELRQRRSPHDRRWHGRKLVPAPSPRKWAYRRARPAHQRILAALLAGRAALRPARLGAEALSLDTQPGALRAAHAAVQLACQQVDFASVQRCPVAVAPVSLAGANGALARNASGHSVGQLALRGAPAAARRKVHIRLASVGGQCIAVFPSRHAGHELAPVRAALRDGVGQGASTSALVLHTASAARLGRRTRAAVEQARAAVGHLTAGCSHLRAGLGRARRVAAPVRRAASTGLARRACAALERASAPIFHRPTLRPELHARARHADGVWTRVGCGGVLPAPTVGIVPARLHTRDRSSFRLVGVVPAAAGSHHQGYRQK